MNFSLLIFLCLYFVSLKGQVQSIGLPAISISAENGAEVTSRSVYTNIVSFVLVDQNNPENNVSKIGFEPQTGLPHEITGYGRSTFWNVSKRSYLIRFRDETSLFGLTAARSWILLSEHYDVTLLKNSFAFELGRRLNVPFTNSYHHVELYLNGQYRGIYIVTEHKQVAPGRVDIDSEEGWFVEMDYNYDYEPRFRTKNYNLPLMINSPDFGADINDSRYDFVRNNWNELCDLMACESFPANGYRDLIDMESIANYFLVPAIIGYADFNIETDTRRTEPGSVFFHKDKDGKISGGILWNFDHSFGFNWSNRPAYRVNSANAYFKADSHPYPNYPFFSRFFQDPQFQLKWKESWNNNRDAIFSMSQFIDDMFQKIRISAHTNFRQWWLNYPVNYDHWINEMKAYLDVRLEYLDKIYNEIEVFPSQQTFERAQFDYSDVSPQTFTLVSYGEMTDLEAFFRSGRATNFEIHTDYIQTPTGNGGYLATISIKPKNSLPAATYNEILVLSAKKNEYLHRMEVQLSFTVRSSLTSNEEEFSSGINVFPNPFTGLVRIIGVNSVSGISSDASLQIINSVGAIVHSQMITSPDETISMERLPAGLYLFRLEKNGTVQTVRVIKE